MESKYLVVMEMASLSFLTDFHMISISIIHILSIIILLLLISSYNKIICKIAKW